MVNAALLLRHPYPLGVGLRGHRRAEFRWHSAKSDYRRTGIGCGGTIVA